MGSHAKPRTTGRKTALGALAVGATLTGVGLTAAALDPATAVLSADSAPGNAGTIQLSGLSTPVAFSPDADGLDPLASLTAAPLAGVGALAGSANGSAGAALEDAGGLAHSATSHTLDVSTSPATGSASGSGSGSAASASGSAASGSGQSAITPIQQISGALTGYSGKHRQTRSAAPPSDVTPLTDEAVGAASSVLPLASGLASQLPVVSDLVQGAGAGGTATGLLGTASGMLGGTGAGPLAGLAGSVPVLGPLAGGSGDGSSTLTVPGLSALSGLVPLTSLPAGL